MVFKGDKFMKKFFFVNLLAYLILSTIRLNVSMNYFINLIPKGIEQYIRVEAFLYVVNIVVQLTLFLSLYAILTVIITMIFKFIFKDKVEMKYAKYYSNLYLLLNSLYTSIIFVIVSALNGDISNFYNGSTQVFVNVFSPVNIIFSGILYYHIVKFFKKQNKPVFKFLAILNLVLYANTAVVCIMLNNSIVSL